MSIDHIRASLTPADLATVNATYSAAVTAIADAQRVYSSCNPNSPARAKLFSHVRALEAQASAAYELAVAELVYAKAAEAASRTNTYDYLAR